MCRHALQLGVAAQQQHNAGVAEGDALRHQRPLLHLARWRQRSPHGRDVVVDDEAKRARFCDAHEVAHAGDRLLRGLQRPLRAALLPAVVEEENVGRVQPAPLKARVQEDEALRRRLRRYALPVRRLHGVLDLRAGGNVACGGVRAHEQVRLDLARWGELQVRVAGDALAEDAVAHARLDDVDGAADGDAKGDAVGEAALNGGDGLDAVRLGGCVAGNEHKQQYRKRWSGE